MEKVYFETSEIAAALGKSTEATRKWLSRHGISRKRGGRWVVTAGRLLAELPEVFQKLASVKSGQKRTEADNP